MNDRKNQETCDDLLDRRAALTVLGAGVAALAGGGGCGGRRGSQPPVEVPVADLERAGRLRVLHGDNPVELQWTDNGVVARSLWCTHFGCEVRWDENQRLYLCPCHEGVFDEHGVVKGGPPPRPLSPYPIEVNDSRVLVGAEQGV